METEKTEKTGKTEKPIFVCKFCGSNITNEDNGLTVGSVIHSIYGFLCYYCNAGLKEINQNE